MAVGCFAEILQFMGEAGAVHVPSILSVAAAGLGDGSPGVRRNSAFCVGIMASIAPDVVAPYYQTFLQGLAPLFSQVCHQTARCLAVGIRVPSTSSCWN
jgi:hypothetical protein